MARLLSEAEAAQVAASVAAAERSTAGEIVVVVAEQSAAYGVERARACFTFTLVVAVVVYSFVHAIPPLWVITGQVPVWLLSWWLSGQNGVVRALVPRAVLESSVASRAKQLFVDQGVTETRERSGVLLYFSEAERRVELVADRGIHERVGSEAWQALVAGAALAIRQGNAASGITAAVDAIAVSLAHHFPVRADDENELSDAVRRV